jgi:Fe-S-cluster containining protein
MPPDSAKSGASGLRTRDIGPVSHARLLQRDTQLIQIVDAALADATRRAGEHLVCRPGCTQCCYGAFAINPLDALRLRSAMAEMTRTQPAQAAAIAQRARQYLAEFAPEFPGDRETGILGVSPEEQSAFEDFANDAPCPALNPQSGLCDLYDARPMTCRVFGPPIRTESERANLESDAEEALAVCELCFTHATPQEIAAAEMHVPHKEEQQVLALLAAEQPATAADTIIAYCLTLPQSAQPLPS